MNKKFLFLLASVCLVFNQIDIDLWTRLAVGREIFRGGAIPLQDPFAFTETKIIWHDHEWLAGVVFYLVWLWFGMVGVWLLNSAFFLGTYHFLVKLGVDRLWLLVSIPATIPIWFYPLRAQAIGYFLFVVLLILWRRAADDKVDAKLFCCVLPFINFIWLNSHGSFVVGAVAGTCALWGIITQHRELLRLCVVSAFLSLFTGLWGNPYGISYFEFLWSAVTHPPHLIPTTPPLVIPEWLSLLDAPEKAIAPLLILIGAFASFKNYKKDIPKLIFMIFCVWLGMKHVRFFPFSVFAALVLFSQELKDSSNFISLKFNRFPLMFERSFYVVGFSFALLGLFQIGENLRLRKEWVSSARFPVEALDYLLKNGTGGKLLTDYNSGSYALWRLYPHYKVSLDGRFDGVYPLATIDLVQDAFTGNSLERENAIKFLLPDYVFLPPSDLQEPPTSCAPWYQGHDGRILKCFWG